MVLVSRKTGKQNFFIFFLLHFQKNDETTNATTLISQKPAACAAAAAFQFVSTSCFGASRILWSSVLALCLVHWAQRRKSKGVTIAEAQELWNFRGFAPVTGKVGFPRTSYNFCWAGGMWPRCMETGSRQWNCNGAAMEKWVVGGNLGSPRRA